MTESLKTSLKHLCDIQDNSLVTILEQVRNGNYHNNKDNTEEVNNIISRRLDMGITDIEVLEACAEISIEIDQIIDGEIHPTDSSNTTKNLLKFVLEEEKDNIPPIDYIYLKHYLMIMCENVEVIESINSGINLN